MFKYLRKETRRLKDNFTIKIRRLDTAGYPMKWWRFWAEPSAYYRVDITYGLSCERCEYSYYVNEDMLRETMFELEVYPNMWYLLDTEKRQKEKEAINYEI